MWHQDEELNGTWTPCRGVEQSLIQPLGGRNIQFISDIARQITLPIATEKNTYDLRPEFSCAGSVVVNEGLFIYNFCSVLWNRGYVGVTIEPENWKMHNMIAVWRHGMYYLLLWFPLFIHTNLVTNLYMPECNSCLEPVLLALKSTEVQCMEEKY